MQYTNQEQPHGYSQRIFESTVTRAGRSRPTGTEDNLSELHPVPRVESPDSRHRQHAITPPDDSSAGCGVSGPRR